MWRDDSVDSFSTTGGPDIEEDKEETKTVGNYLGKQQKRTFLKESMKKGC